MSEIYSIIVYNIDTSISIHFMPDSACWGVVPPIPELTSGRKIKGTETHCHTMMEIGTSLITGQKTVAWCMLQLMNACVVAM